MPKFHFILRFVSLAGLASMAVALSAQTPLDREEYSMPPAPVAKILLAPRQNNVALTNLSPDRKRFLIVERDGMPPLAVMGKPHVNLGGFQVDMVACRSRTLTTRYNVGLAMFNIADGKRIEVEVPKGATVSSPAWSPDGTRIAFLADFDDSTLLCVADATSGKSKIVSKRQVLATAVTSVEWTNDGAALATVLVPTKRAPMPTPSSVAKEPRVRVADGAKHRIRTYPSLLDNPYERALYEYCTTGQFAVVDVNSGAATEIGSPAMISGVNPSPSGGFFIVTTIQKPFSYIVPTSSFGTKEELWDVSGKVVSELSRRNIQLGEAAGPGPTADDDSDSPYGDGLPLDEQARGQRGAGGGQRGGGAAQDGRPRAYRWRPDGQGLSFLQLEPAPPRPTGDDADAAPAPQGPPARRKDRVMQWLPPYAKDGAKAVFESPAAITSVEYSEDCKTLFITDTAGTNRRVSAVQLSGDRKPHVLSSAAADEFYNPPGNLLTWRGARGSVVEMSADGKFVYLSGTTYSKEPRKEAPKPFVDKVEIDGGKKQRVFESSADSFEQFTDALDGDLNRFVITRQSHASPPDYFVKSSGGERKLTENKDYTPEITACRREIVDVTRPDGFKFQVRLTMPSSFVTGSKMPAFFWFYPAEFTDQAGYDRTIRAYNKNLYQTAGGLSAAAMTQAGYVVVEPDCPIVGPTGHMNDNYVSDLLNNLSSIIDTLERRGFIDRTKLAIGGHSYGAFSTANALTHTPFFKAGIAGDGAYNRSLTPFGFQTEERQFWEDRELYLGMSPFLYANQITGALLMYHSMEDQNVGTDPINSKRLFDALDSMGKPVALYMYPYEDHGPIAKETILDIWSRWVAWLDKYVK